MARRFSLEADISPTVDETAAEREASGLAQTFEDEMGDLDVGVDGGGVGSLGGARGGGGGGMLGSAAAGGVARTAGAGGLGAAASAAAPVAIAGAVGFGILSGIQTLASASPALKQTTSIFGEAMDLFFRPFGDFLSATLRPTAEALLDFAVGFNRDVGPVLTNLGDELGPVFKKGAKSVVAGLFPGGLSIMLADTVGSALVDWSEDLADDLGGVIPTKSEVLNLFQMPSASDLLGLFGMVGPSMLLGRFSNVNSSQLLGKFSMPDENDILSLFPTIDTDQLLQALTEGVDRATGGGGGGGDGGGFLGGGDGGTGGGGGEATGGGVSVDDEETIARGVRRGIRDAGPVSAPPSQAERDRESIRSIKRTIRELRDADNDTGSEYDPF